MALPHVRQRLLVHCDRLLGAIAPAGGGQHDRITTKKAAKVINFEHAPMSRVVVPLHGLALIHPCFLMAHTKFGRGGVLLARLLKQEAALFCVIRLLAWKELGHLSAADLADALDRPPPVLHRHFLGIVHRAFLSAFHAVRFHVHAMLLLDG